MFLLLSALTSVLECAPLLAGAALGLPPWQLLALCLAYQLGNLFPTPFRLGRRALPGIAASALLLSPLPGLCGGVPLLWWGTSLLTVFCLSCTFQSVRACQKSATGTALKRLARVLGFLLTPLAARCIPAVFAVCSVLVLAALTPAEPRTASTPDIPPLCRMLPENPGLPIMLWHQLHYFIYAHSMILTVRRMTGRPTLTMALFAFTWVTYLSVEPWIKRSRGGRGLTVSEHVTLVLRGHAFLFILLLLLPIVRTPAAAACLWALTGLGGGTVFAISALCRAAPGYQKDALDLTENLGHIGGTLIAVLYLLLFPGGLTYLPWLSALCAAAVFSLSHAHFLRGGGCLAHEDSNGSR